MKKLLTLLLLSTICFAQSQDSLKQEEYKKDFIQIQRQIASTDSLRIKLQGVSEFLQYKYQAIEEKKKKK